jgi:predicted naringenin-chalcone synthase
MTTAYLNRIAGVVPPHDVHAAFLHFAESLLLDDQCRAALFRRMARWAGIEHRYSLLSPAHDPEGTALDTAGLYVRGKFPTTAVRMRFFEAHAPKLAAAAVEGLELDDERDGVTHLLITSCTGFSAPGLDLEVIERCRLPISVERTIVGFMGCYAALNALKLARHIVRSEPEARVLIVNLELCTLHLHETTDLEEILSFLLWGDGCAASLVTAKPTGLALEAFQSTVLPNTRDLLKWHIGDSGFDMVLAGQVPAAIHEGLRAHADEVLGGAPASSIDLWAVHPGGRTIVDAVERAFDLTPAALLASREVLRRFGNMSSATVMFVLERILRSAEAGATGCAMSFGPGLVVESMRFRGLGQHVSTAPHTA